jgi:hypothetical protein
MLTNCPNPKCGVAFADSFVACPACGTPTGGWRDPQLARLARENAALHARIDWEERRRGLLYWNGREPRPIDSVIKLGVFGVASLTVFLASRHPAAPLIAGSIGILGAAGALFSHWKWRRFRNAREKYLPEHDSGD